MKTAIFRFDEGLRELLPKSWRQSAGAYEFSGPQSAKHLTEALGIPHTEVGAILVNGLPSDTGYLVQDGDLVQLSGVSSTKMSDEPRFVIDGHLGRLNAGLRMLGFDCVYHRQYADTQLAAVSINEDRILLTRDRRLLMRKQISRGYLIRTLDPRTQLTHVSLRFGLKSWARPFRRCIRCNALLRPVDKNAVLSRLEPLTRLYFDEFRICTFCGQIYWKGSHFQRMQQLISDLDLTAKLRPPE